MNNSYVRISWTFLQKQMNKQLHPSDLLHRRWCHCEYRHFYLIIFNMDAFLYFSCSTQWAGPSGKDGIESVWADGTFFWMLFTKLREFHAIPYLLRFFFFKLGLELHFIKQAHYIDLECHVIFLVLFADVTNTLTIFTCYTITHEPHSVACFHSPGGKGVFCPRCSFCCHCLCHLLWSEFSWTSRGPAALPSLDTLSRDCCP